MAPLPSKGRLPLVSFKYREQLKRVTNKRRQALWEAMSRGQFYSHAYVNTKET